MKQAGDKVDSARWSGRDGSRLAGPKLRRWPVRAVAMVAATGAAGALAVAVPTSGGGTGEPADAMALSTMVELAGSESGSQVMYLDDLSEDVLERLETGGSDGWGIDVALIDSGVAPVEGLDGGNVLHGPDLSGEGVYPEVAYLDTFGHGTHMAGIIAGTRDGHTGLAPGARIVSLKVAGADGITTVPQVVAAIDWVVDHHDSHGLNIKVLNLSLGLAGVDDHRGDLLSAAVERAWAEGIFVVVSAGNKGEDPGHLDSPAIDPYVMAVGAGDNTNGLDEEDQPPTGFSSRGDGVRNPDLMAPGLSIASYRVPGSTIDGLAPSAQLGEGLFKGSGTSQAAAVVSGAAARLLSTYPSMTNDEVKETLVETTEHDLGYGAHVVGTGMIDAEDAWEYPEYGNVQQHPSASGKRYGIVAPTGATWSGGGWSDTSWSGATWSGATWSGATWSGATWSGATWSGATWSGATWSGATWSGATWSGEGWS